MFLPQGYTANAYTEPNQPPVVWLADRQGNVVLKVSPSEAQEIGAALQKLAWDEIRHLIS